ncbi:MAG: hypothetical protein A2073_04760 [Deltaproteobacteria bacterium GWC2_42_11]|nr:MAG: hypothetical protein A2073_04760 [Deltaproteobacteria bacterium GWC2_42_11]
MAIPSFAMELLICKIAIKNLAILQTGDLPDPSFAWVPRLRCRRIFAPHRIGEHTARRKNGLRLVWQATYQFPQKTMSIFDALVKSRHTHEGGYPELV